MGIIKIIVNKYNQLKNNVLENGLVKFIIRVATEFGKDDSTTLAAGISYYIFLSLFPLILALIGILGYILPSSDIQNQLFTFFQNNIPGAVDVLQNNIQRVVSLRGALGVIGIIGLLWSGSGAMAALAHGINIAWDIPREMQFYLKKIRDIILTIGLGLLFFPIPRLTGVIYGSEL